MIGSKIIRSQHVADIFCGGYNLLARLQLLLEFTQHMLFKFLCPRPLGVPCVMHPLNKRTGFYRTLMQVFEGFSVWHASRRKSFPVQSLGLQGIPIRNAVNEMDIDHFMIRVAGNPCSHQKRKHDECRQPELL
ncbi:hypothetical protein TNIN_403601 [Trichonephila inaurata madagascariensis]|uniref:Uncharacterized protein n=1 Tax=Trichonephila inaurata madagascariensis TaxID=2747483 RepID=A0A8X7CQ66_9ARAC|nr:hypothetical protein TNIN_403601 [Trichonephila inaurata madagascariensis]